MSSLVAIVSVEGSNRNFVPRGPTGKKAEQFFMSYHTINGLPFPGKLSDTRENGCGYDFEILTKDEKVFVEVKGLASKTGGIVFTSKEWRTAKRLRKAYYLVIIRNVDADPEIEIIQNPAAVLNPQKNIVTSIQIQYSLSHKELGKGKTDDK